LGSYGSRSNRLGSDDEGGVKERSLVTKLSF
jgi:hypothetical protein